MFDDWPTDCREIANRLRPSLCRYGADFYRQRREHEVWVGWPRPSGVRHKWLAQLRWRTDGSVKLKLRVGRDSGLVGPNRPLQLSSESRYKDSECDSGLVELTKQFPADLPKWVDAAFRFCSGKYGIALNHESSGLSADPSHQVQLPHEAPVLAFPSAPPQAQDLAAPPAERVQTTVSRIVRDTQLSNRVKEMHHYECQLCGHTILLADGSRYAEGHHVQPLGAPHDGPDVLDNIVCLCPNHHAACDLGAIRLTLDESRPADGHTVGQRYLDYHNKTVYRGSGCA